MESTSQTNDTLKILLLGKGKLACQIASFLFHNPNHYELRGIVPNIPRDTFPSLEEWALRHNYPPVQIIRSGRFQDVAMLRDGIRLFDLALSVNYDRILSEQFLSYFKRSVNIHNAPLPKYAGVSPINWALENCEQYHGVTIHDILPGIDDGPILAQCTFPIDHEVDEVIDVLERCQNFGFMLFKQVIGNILRLESIPQESAKRTYFSKSLNSELCRKTFSRASSFHKKDYSLFSNTDDC
jgi:methionyl-tRNA formyltransferase